ncbi:MAG TPA: hypothetical protein VFD91_01545 [Mariniphaga sp.]|nr:hypothetical protein [Mariniphaga sp.]
MRLIRLDHKLFLLFIIFIFGTAVKGFPQSLSQTFEIRYFTQDRKANGETDFKGETEWFDTEGRVSFLKAYADFASDYFNNKALDQQIVEDEEVSELINSIKPQPLTNIRKTIVLNDWRSYGYKNGQEEQKKQELRKWESIPGAQIQNGKLVFENTSLSIPINPMNWRFSLSGKIMLNDNKKAVIEFKEGETSVITLKIGDRQNQQVDVVEFLIEGDLEQKRFNSYINGIMVDDFILMADTSINSINALSISVKGKGSIDDIFLFNHIRKDDVNYPYYSEVVIDENFEVKPDISGWHSGSFDDSHWEVTDLPAVHGGLREKEESLYLRKQVYVDEFERAFLQVETLDPGGEVWVNNEVVAVVNDRHPQELELTPYLLRNSNNLIAIKVKPYKLSLPMPHTPTDHHIGWFLGRTKLLLTSACRINEMFVSTQGIKDNAIQHHKMTIHNPGHNFFEGKVEINYYPWYPEEGEKSAHFSEKVKLRPRIKNELAFEFPVPDAELWSPDSPNLYRVEVILRDHEGQAIDDYVTTTGIRTVEQKNGLLYVNGTPEMFNGAQIMGFRTPIETVAKHNRCAPIETIAEELLMNQKMNSNLLRIHVHAEKDTADGINDPRYAEIADQMGMYLFWSTAAFIREGESWNIDYAGYPKFMKQVMNHPSIVIWEASNHPNRFKKHDVSETHDFVKEVVTTISDTDRSRLISPTTFWQHTHYANYDGTIDNKGNAITAVAEFMDPLVTRGSQDAYTGYGAEWTKLRKAPNAWAASCLAANDKAYFNFEHEESIGQPNWDLSKGKPWYLVQSYEWSYDEGSIGRRLTTDEWRESQAWQAFSAWESMKRQMLLGYDGFSWCCLRGGANMGTYQKPLIDNLRHPKLAFYTNKMVFQETWAASENVDVAYGPDDLIKPVIHHLGTAKTVDLIVELKNIKGKIIDTKRFRNLKLQEGRNTLSLGGFRFKNVKDGVYGITYQLINR